jgi:hypothetical protein
MTFVANPSSSSTSTLQNLSAFPLLSSGVARIQQPSFTLGENPGQAQLQLNRLVAEALHGEVSVELRNAELEKAATRALLTFGLLHQSTNIKSLELLSNTSGVMSGEDAMAVDEEKGKAATEEMKGWESIQEYGKYLGATAELLTVHTNTLPSDAEATTQPPLHTGDAEALPSPLSFDSPIEQLRFRSSRFAAEFADLAPLTSRENRIHARQTTNLIEWISDPANDELFPGWCGLDQIGNRPASPEEHQQKEDREVEALERILEVRDEERRSSTEGKGELGWHSVGMGEGRPSSLAKYLSQDAPPSKRRRLEVVGTRGTTERSRSNNAQTGVSGEDTPRVVSQDNHWRRTIFG